MKRGKVLSIIAIAVVLVSSLLFSSEVYATSRTTTLEVAGTSRTAQVLGERRDGVVSGQVSTSQITNASALAILKDLDAIVKILNRAGIRVTKDQITILDSMEVIANPGVVVSEQNPLFVSFSFPGVLADTKAYILHYENNQWVVVPTEIVDGLIVGEFTSLSPVAVVADKTTLGSSVLGANRAKSPRTGDSICMIVAICVAGVVISSVVAYKAKKRA